VLVAVGVAGGLWRPASVGFGGLFQFSVLLGVCCGCVLCPVFPVVGGFSWFAGGSAGGALVASAGRVRSGCGRLSLAVAVVCAVVLRRGRCRWLCVAGRCVLVRLGLVGLGGASVRGSALPWCGGSSLGRVGAGRLLAVAAAGWAGCAACSGVGLCSWLAGRSLFWWPALRAVAVAG